MENNQNPVQETTKKSPFPPSSYTLLRSAGVEDNTLYLHKDGAMARCPYQSRVNDKGEVMIHPCGSFCQFFNLMPREGQDGGGINKISVLLSCGAGLKLPITKYDLNPSE